MAWENLQRDVLKEFARYGELYGIRYGNELEAAGLSVLRSQERDPVASARHSARTASLRRAERREAKAAAPRTCELPGCGADTTLAPRGQRYCSRRCRNRARRLVPAGRRCAECGADFVPSRSTNLFCGKACSGVARRRRRGKEEHA